MEIPAGWDVVIHPKGSVEKAPFEGLSAEFLRVLEKL